MGCGGEARGSSALFASSHVSFVAFSGLSDSSSSPHHSLCLPHDDPLQCFLPSPFSFNSLPALLPATASPAASNPPPPALCLASVSAAESFRRVNLLPSALPLVIRGNRSSTPLGTSSVKHIEFLEEKAGPSAARRGETHQATGALTTSKHLLAGALSAVISRTLVAPLERVKLEYILRGATSDAGDVVRMIISTEGLRGFWKGNLVNLIRTAPFKSINFYAYDTFRKRIASISGRKEVTNLEKLGVGAAAGIFATIICFPLDTIRTRMVAPGGEALGGIAGCCRHLVSSQGLSSLYAGLMPALLSMAPAGAVFYGVYDILKSGHLESPAGQREAEQRRKRSSGDHHHHQQQQQQMELGPLRTLVYGAIAGACAETVTYPLEVVRRHLQMQDAASRLGLIRTVQGIVQEKGVGALYAGLLPSTLQVLPSAALSYFVYEWLKLSMKVS